MPHAYDGTKINNVHWEYDLHLGYNVKRNKDVEGKLLVNLRKDQWMSSLWCDDNKKC